MRSVIYVADEVGLLAREISHLASEVVHLGREGRSFIYEVGQKSMRLVWGRSQIYGVSY